MEDWSPKGLPLAAFVADARSLDVKAFAAKYATAFLMRHQVSMPFDTGPMRTRVPGMEERLGDSTGDVVVIIHRVRRRPNNEHAFVAVGRLEGNDIAIVDDTVSKFHAYLKESPQGFHLQDGRSRNGTLVDGKPVARRGEGAPTLLRSGDTVRFGSVSTTFLDAGAFIELARRLS